MGGAGRRWRGVLEWGRGLAVVLMVAAWDGGVGALVVEDAAGGSDWGEWGYWGTGAGPKARRSDIIEEHFYIRVN